MSSPEKSHLKITIIIIIISIITFGKAHPMLSMTITFSIFLWHPYPLRALSTYLVCLMVNPGLGYICGYTDIHVSPFRKHRIDKFLYQLPMLVPNGN